MNKGVLSAGIGLFFLGAAAFVLYVLPWIFGTRAQEAATSYGAVGPSSLAVVLATIGLAAGSALIGIGLGHWSKPRPSRVDGSPEV